MKELTLATTIKWIKKKSICKWDVGGTSLNLLSTSKMGHPYWGPK